MRGLRLFVRLSRRLRGSLLGRVRRLGCGRGGVAVEPRGQALRLHQVGSLLGMPGKDTETFRYGVAALLLRVNVGRLASRGDSGVEKGRPLLSPGAGPGVLVQGRGEKPMGSSVRSGSVSLVGSGGRRGGNGAVQGVLKPLEGGRALVARGRSSKRGEVRAGRGARVGRVAVVVAGRRGGALDELVGGGPGGDGTTAREDGGARVVGEGDGVGADARLDAAVLGLGTEREPSHPRTGRRNRGPGHSVGGSGAHGGFVKFGQRLSPAGQASRQELRRLGPLIARQRRA